MSSSSHFLQNSYISLIQYIDSRRPQLVLTFSIFFLFPKLQRTELLKHLRYNLSKLDLKSQPSINNCVHQLLQQNLEINSSKKVFAKPYSELYLRVRIIGIKDVKVEETVKKGEEPIYSRHQVFECVHQPYFGGPS